MGAGSGWWVRGRCLGRGSTAAVHLASSTTSGEQETFFAVKSTELSRSAPLQREQKILSSLCSPHVVSCLGSDVRAEPDGRVLYNLFMEYVPGGSLSETIKQHGRLDDHTIGVYTRGILNGLAYLHSRGIVHCDVKGQNILVGKCGGSVKLADLGCARWVDDGSDGGGVIGGTPLYMAPEVARGEEQGPGADIWALGCTMIEMSTGCPPWRDITDPVAAIHRIAFSGDVPELPCNVSDDARDFLGRCLNRDPRMRWSAGELLLHPFVKCCEEFTTDCSPKSTLDQVFWNSWQEEDDEDEDEAKPHLDDQPLESVPERLGQLVGSHVSSRPAADATWEESCWMTVRSGVTGGSSCLVSSEASSRERFEVPIGEDEPPASCSGSAEAAVDGVGGKAEPSCYCDCSVVRMEGYLPSSPYSYSSVSWDNVFHLCTILSVDEGNDLFVYNQTSEYASLLIA